MRRIVIIVQAAVFLVLMITACGISVAQSSEIPRSWTMSNDKAKAALSGDATAISALADDALQGSLILQHLSTVEPNIKNVLVSAEVASQTASRGERCERSSDDKRHCTKDWRPSICLHKLR